MQQDQEGFTGAAGTAFTDTGRDARAGARPDGSRECGEVAIATVPLTQSGEESSGGEAAPRLVKRIYFDTPYRIRSRNYGEGLAEVGWSFIGRVPESKASKGLSTERTANEMRAVRHAKSRLRQLILSANLTHLLTLTYRENVTDFKRASDDLNRFIRKVKRHLPHWLYVAVAEQQERGAWHWHIAVRGFQDVELLRKLWWEVVGEGNIDVSAPEGSRKEQRLHLVKYLGKYLVKAFANGQRTLNQHRFRASRKIKVQEDCFHIVPQSGLKLDEAAIANLYAEAGSVGFVWNSDDKLCGWACSWK